MNKITNFSIGHLVKETGLTVHSIRAWETRYGFPKPIRLDSGHRRYSSNTVKRLSTIAQVVRLGFRPSKAIKMPIDELEAIIIARHHKNPHSVAITNSIKHVKSYEWNELTKIFNRQLKNGIFDFCDNFLGPLISEVGLSWQRGELEIRHEHAFSNNVIHFLNSLLNKNKSTLRQHSKAIFCTLANEEHQLGLKMAQACLSSKGYEILYLGGNVPADEIVKAQSEMDAEFIFISISIYTSSKHTLEALAQLRKALPSEVTIVIGGQGVCVLDQRSKGIVKAFSFDDMNKILL